MKLNKPSISIVMPLYNKEKEVRRSITSILTQTVDDYELIVINDGSTDNGPLIAGSIKDSRIKIIDQSNFGVSAARNRGIQEAQSDLIAFLDADDEWKPLFLETIVKLKNKFPDCSIFATGYAHLDPDGTLRAPIINGIPPHPWQGIFENYFQIAAKSSPPIWTSAVAVTKLALTAINGFPVGIKSGEDLLTWARLATQNKIAYDSTSLALFRQRTAAHEKPTRPPDTPDNVGRLLKELQKSIPPPEQKSLRHYIALWHKNRASVYLRLNQRTRAVKEVFQMGYYNLNRKFFIYCVCLLLPVSFIYKLIHIHNKKPLQ